MLPLKDLADRLRQPLPTYPTEPVDGHHALALSSNCESRTAQHPTGIGLSSGTTGENTLSGNR